MKINISLTEEEIKEAVLYYINEKIDETVGMSLDTFYLALGEFHFIEKVEDNEK
jgi:hypothetical protein